MDFLVFSSTFLPNYMPVPAHTHTDTHTYTYTLVKIVGLILAVSVLSTCILIVCVDLFAFIHLSFDC